ncbi:MAG TPA: CD225/dispanin family protein [Amycolatopsis sp.]|nr:CD225/dispanin family protein [Amycolatopsis sp.]
MTQPPYQHGPRPIYGPPPESNLVWAILATVMCCLPLGIVALVKAGEVDSLWMQGRHEEAQASADAAKKWSIWAAVAGGVLVLAAIIMLVVMLVFVGETIDRLTRW